MNKELYENKIHGSKSFPFNIYPCSIPLDFQSVPLHWQEGMEIIFIKKGKGIVQVSTEIFEAKEKDIFIVPPTFLHALRSMHNHSMEYENFLFDLRFIGLDTKDKCLEYLIPLSQGNIKIPYLINENNMYYHHLKNCLIETENLCKLKKNGYELGVKANMLQFIYYLFELSNNNQMNKTIISKRLTKVLELIENNYSQNISIEDASLICGYSCSHFMKWFKNMTGSSFTSYLNERRLVESSRLLINTNDTILLIAQNVGFENLSNFNRQFKKKYGISPREYRISMKKQKNMLK